LCLILSFVRLHFAADVVVCFNVCWFYCCARTNHSAQCSWQLFHFYAISTVLYERSPRGVYPWLHGYKAPQIVDASAAGFFAKVT
ncbi:hypothetical protein EDB85DRAFT_1968782, partial [Lactarius pseudohatsudake]